MIIIGILGDIGSGKSYVAQNFGYPVFNADYEVAKLYHQNKNIFNRLKAKLPKYIKSFPIEKKEISDAKKTFQKYKWPSIDVTRKSVEETAASIIKIHEIYLNNVK